MLAYRKFHRYVLDWPETRPRRNRCIEPEFTENASLLTNSARFLSANIKCARMKPTPKKDRADKEK